MTIPTKTLKTQRTIPLLGLGTWQLTGTECSDIVARALDTGYRHIDTADHYGNHQSIAEALNHSSVSRHDVYITTKIWRSDLHTQDIIDNTKRFLQELQLDYLDLLLIHWPNSDIAIQDTLTGLKELQEAKLIRDYGVSNFTPRHLEEVLRYDRNVVANQVELHPTFQQPDLLAFHEAQNIATTAYSPLGRADDLELEPIITLAKKHEVTPAQVILAWFRQKGIITIPKTSTPERLEENLASLELMLTQDDMMQIDSLDRNNRLIDPDFSEFDS